MFVQTCGLAYNNSYDFFDFLWFPSTRPREKNCLVTPLLYCRYTRVLSERLRRNWSVGTTVLQRVRDVFFGLFLCVDVKIMRIRKEWNFFFSGFSYHEPETFRSGIRRTCTQTENRIHDLCGARSAFSRFKIATNSAGKKKKKTVSLLRFFFFFNLNEWRT